MARYVPGEFYPSRKEGYRYFHDARQYENICSDKDCGISLHLARREEKELRVVNVLTIWSTHVDGGTWHEMEFFPKNT